MYADLVEPSTFPLDGLVSGPVATASASCCSYRRRLALWSSGHVRCVDRRPSLDPVPCMSQARPPRDKGDHHMLRLPVIEQFGEVVDMDVLADLRPFPMLGREEGAFGQTIFASVNSFRSSVWHGSVSPGSQPSVSRSPW